MFDRFIVEGTLRSAVYVLLLMQTQYWQWCFKRSQVYVIHVKRGLIQNIIWQVGVSSSFTAALND